MIQIENTIALRVQHYKGVEQLQVTLEPGVSVFGGKNGAGKSSVLDAVANAFGGKKLTPPRPVKDGAEAYECAVALEALGVEIRRTGRIGEDGKLREKLTITDAEGFKSPSPQALLDKLLNGSSIRPMAFAELSKAEQIKTLKAAAGVDWAALDEAYSKAYEARHDAKAKAAVLQAQLGAFTVMTDPGAAVDTKAIQKSLEAAMGAAVKARAAAAAEAERKKTLKMLQVQLKQARATVSRLEKEIARHQNIQAPPTAPDNIEELRAAYDKADAQNAAVQAWQRREQVREELTAARTEELKQAGLLAEIGKQKKEQLAAAELPVPGLTFDEDGVYLHGVPFEQASQSEQLEASVRLGLALHPRVPIVLVQEGSSFDAEHLALLDKAAKEHGAFVFAEVVMDEPRAGVKVFMTNGMGEVHDAEVE